MERTVRGAFVGALGDWRRHAAALLLVAAAYAAAAAVATDVAYYAAGLVAFSVWMGWFVLTGVRFLRLLGV